jgi:hypothetical protein
MEHSDQPQYDCRPDCNHQELSRWGSASQQRELARPRERRQAPPQESCTAAVLLSLPDAEFGVAFGPPFATATKAGRSTRSPIM